MMATLSFMNVSQDCLALFCLDTALVDTSDTAPDQLSVDYGIGCHSVLHLPGQDFISWQLSVY